MQGIVFQKDRFTRDDISQAVSIHRREIGQGFLSSLGDKALELIFSSASESRSGVLIIAKDALGGQACGFVCGTTNTGALYKDFLLKKSWSAIVTLAPRLLSPGKLWKVFETLTYPARKTTPSMPAAELLDIAVDGQYRGSGLAQQLFHEFAGAVGDRGIERFKVGTGESLSRAQRFYEKLGARRVASIEVHRGQKSFIYLYEIARNQ